jgi:glycosyltransferase involved in cell wall biosynthesis
MNRRLLLVCYFYPPLAGGGVHRVLGFTRHLPAFGWDCTVVCAGGDDYWVRDETLEIPPGTEVIRVPGGSALSAWLRLRGGAGGQRSAATFGTLRRLGDWWMLPDSYVGWSRRARRAVGRRLAAGGVDAVLSSSPPDSAHLAVRAPVTRARVPWIADFRDPWIGLHFRTPPTAWHRARQERMERQVVEHADRVLVASRTHGDQLVAALPQARERVEYLPNGFEPADGGAALESGAPAAPPERFLVVFTGTLAQMPDACTFLEAVHEVLAHRSEARRRLRVKFAGPYETGVEDRAIALGLKGIVEFLGPVSHPQARALQHEADLLMLWKPSGAGFRTMVPGKLYEYLDSGRPLLAMLEPGDEAARLAERGGATVKAPGDRAAIAAAIAERYEAWRQGGHPPTRRPEWLGEHTRARLTARLAEILESLRR